MLQAQTSLKAGTWYTFNQTNLVLVPEDSGVYWLGADNRVIYIGSAVNMQDRLSDHYYTPDSCTRKATQFAIEPCSNYKERERLLLLAYKAKHGRLPECNDRVP